MSERKYFTVSKFINEMCEMKYSDCKYFNIIFEKESINKNQYKEYVVEVIGIQFIHNEQNVCWTYNSILEKFGGKLYLKFKYSEDRKIKKSPLQILHIENTKSEYKGFTYFPSKVVELNDKSLHERLQKIKTTTEKNEEIFEKCELCFI